MTKKEFLQLLKRIKAERLLSSEADNLFSSAKGDIYSLSLNFLRFSSVIGRQIDSEYDDGFIFECITEEEFDVAVLFQRQFKELVESLSGQSSQEINVKVLGYDSLYQKAILGYFEGEINEQELQTEDGAELEVGADEGILPKLTTHQFEGYKPRPSEKNRTSAQAQKKHVEKRTQTASTPTTELPGSWRRIKVALFLVVCVPIFLFYLSRSLESEDEMKSLKSYRESISKDVAFNEWENNYQYARAEYERGELAKARNFILMALNVIKNKGVRGSKTRIQTITHRSYFLLGRIYDRAGESYQSCMSFLKAKKSVDRLLRKNLHTTNQQINDQFRNLKDQGMGGLIDENQKTLNPVNQEWVESVIRIAADNKLIELVKAEDNLQEQELRQILNDEPEAIGENMILIQTKEPYSGWAKFFHDSGSIKELIHFHKGQRHGHYRSWKIDGSVESIATYNKGMKTGMNPTFGDDGKAYNIPMYKDGKLLKP